MTKSSFSSPEDSHRHSLQTLDLLYMYADFMESIDTLADMGCGSGLDLEWWATRTTQGENPKPLNIRCTGVDTIESSPIIKQHRNISYRRQDFETEPIKVHNKTFDVIWCHDAFQFVIDPFLTLKQWRDVLSKDGMLALVLPQSTNVEFNTQAFDQRDYCYHNWTMVSLIHVLAVSGFDCRGGYFLKNPEDTWLHAVVYRSEIEPMDPRVTRWYDLVDLGLLPESMSAGIKKYGYARQRDLVLTWLDKGARTYARH
jgi:SAM-dependent methyltransferase